MGFGDKVNIPSIHELDDPGKARLFLGAVKEHFNSGYSRTATSIILAGTYSRNTFNSWLVRASQSANISIPPETV